MHNIFMDPIMAKMFGKVILRKKSIRICRGGQLNFYLSRKEMVHENVLNASTLDTYIKVYVLENIIFSFPVFLLFLKFHCAMTDILHSS